MACVSPDTEYTTDISLYLVFNCPGVDVGRLDSDPGEWILAADDQNDDDELQYADHLSQGRIQLSGRIVVTLDDYVGVLLLDGIRKLFEDFPVASGITATGIPIHR